jgi:hypothetical protein
MDDPLTKIFNPKVIEKLDGIVSKSEVLQFRLAVLQADHGKQDPPWSTGNEECVPVRQNEPERLCSRADRISVPPRPDTCILNLVFYGGADKTVEVGPRVL